jgi:PEGA domain-containing protein
MITAQDLFPDQTAAEAGGDKRLTTWYAQGQTDGLGDRLLMFDNTNAPSWEILRFKPALARDAGFEAALRGRVEALATFQHEAFPLVRPIKRLGHDDGLAVVSTYSGGAPLSEALKKPRSAEFALRLIRQLVPALAALQRLVPGMAHGAITVERINLAPDGRLMIREHMVGAALDHLEWPATRLWSEFGILVPRTSGAVRIDERTDITQFGLVVLSLMAGRRIGPDEYPDKINELLDELTLKNHWLNPSNPAKFQALRHWLERALQVSGQSFTSAHDAQLALADLGDPAEASSSRSNDALRPSPKQALTKEESAQATWPAGRALSLPAVQPSKPARVAASSLSTAPPAPVAVERGRAARLWQGIPPAVTRWASVALAVLAVIEGVYIGRLLSAPAAVETPRAMAPPPAQPASIPEIQPIQQAPAVTPQPVVVSTGAASQNPRLPEIRALRPPGDAVRTGGVRVAAPIELHVLEGERVVGSTTDGPIIIAAGRHEFDFVNSAIGFRVRQTVDVKVGQITTFNVAVPNGTLNINAQPWAMVSIDGTAVGETPLGNLSVLPGEHVIVFSHPQLGERRERANVRPGAETRVAVDLQK